MGKENQLPDDAPYLRLGTLPASPTLRQTPPLNDNPRKWDPVDGKIIVKVRVPATDDIWRFKVAEDVSLVAFQQIVEAKVGFPVILGRSELDVISEEMQFKRWVEGRVRNGRNTLLTARPAWHIVKDMSSL